MNRVLCIYCRHFVFSPGKWEYDENIWPYIFCEKFDVDFLDDSATRAEFVKLLERAGTCSEYK